jgi:cell division transport system ATP-binding protein
VIRFDSVSKRYPNGHEALAAVSFDIDAGEMVFVTGHSGAGKSSLLKLIAALERPSRGAVLVAGQNLNQLKPRQIPAHRRRIGLVYQDHRLLMDRTCADNVALPLLVSGVARRDADKRVRAALDQVGLAGKERAAPSELSGGEQQRLGIARAIVARPPLLLADEPTGNLDPALAQEIMALFALLQQTGVTVLVASHDLHLIQRMRKRVLVLEHGALIDDFRPKP